MPAARKIENQTMLIRQASGPIAIFGLALALVSACASVPPGSVATNQAVSEGIERLKTQHETTINALAEQTRISTYQMWDHVTLSQVVADELRRACSSPQLQGGQSVDASNSHTNTQNCPDTLTPEQAATAAATAADIREAQINKINGKEAELLASVKAKYNGVKSLNNVVTRYLTSLVELKAATDDIRGQLMETLGLDESDIPEHLSELLAISKEAIQVPSQP